MHDEKDCKSTPLFLKQKGQGNVPGPFAAVR